MKTIIEILLVLLDLVTFVIILQAIMSWLIQFNVINTSNDIVRSIWTTLDRLTAPIYRPIRRILPDMGALDLSPLVVLLIIMILRRIVVPNFYMWYIGQGYL